MSTIQKGIFILTNLFMLYGLINGDCGNVPEIPNSSNNSTGAVSYVSDTAIRYSCHPYHKGIGSRYYYCVGTGWVGNYTCLLSCGLVEAPSNGIIVGNPSYVVATRVEFACSDGYDLVGFTSMLCRADGNYRPSTPPTCSPVSCGQFSGVDNGRVFQISPDGILNDFQSVIEITCDDGYTHVGSRTVTCQSDEIWSEKPECRASTCGTHPGSKSKCIADSNLSLDGSIYTILCKDASSNVSVTEIGSLTDICIDSKWDELDMGCFCDCMVDTSVKGVDYKDLHQSKFVKHKKELNWDCKEGYKKVESGPIVCTDGQMEQPHCEAIEGKEFDKWGLVVLGILGGFAFAGAVGLLIYCVQKKKKDNPGRSGHERVPLDDKVPENV